jgi:hypothetical protein
MPVMWRRRMRRRSGSLGDRAMLGRSRRMWTFRFPWFSVV